MPNLCDNKLVISGKTLSLYHFRTCIEATKKDNEYRLLNTFMPCPEPLINASNEDHHQNEKEYGHKSWYSWRLAHWGVKWEGYHVELTAKPRSLILTFCTAWVPPIKGLKTISQYFPGLTFRLHWREEGGECGREVFRSSHALSFGSVCSAKKTKEDDNGKAVS